MQVLVLVQRSSVLCMLSRLVFYCLKYHNVGHGLLMGGGEGKTKEKGHGLYPLSFVKLQ